MRQFLPQRTLRPRAGLSRGPSGNRTQVPDPSWARVLPLFITMSKTKTPTATIKDLLAALGQAEGQLRVAFDTLQRFNVGSDIDRRRLKGRWKKRTPKLGRAIIDMLGKEGQPDIFARLQVSAETLSDRDAVVDRL